MSTNATIVATPGAARAAWQPATVPFPPAVRDYVPPPLTSTRAQNAERDAFEQGLADGFLRAEQQFAADHSAMMERLRSTIAAIGDERLGVLRQSERDLVRLAVAIAERILGREIAADPALLLTMARAAASRIGGQPVLTIHMNPADVAAITKESSDALPESVQLVPSTQIDRGGGHLETSFGPIDLAVTAQIREVLDQLLADDGAR